MHFPGFSDKQLSSVDRMDQNNPQHQDLLGSYVKGRPTRSLAPEQFRFIGTYFRLNGFIYTQRFLCKINLIRWWNWFARIDGVINDGLEFTTAKREQAAKSSVRQHANVQNRSGQNRATASTMGSIEMSISSTTSLLRNDSGRNSKPKKSTRGSIRQFQSMKRLPLAWLNNEKPESLE